MKTKQNTTGGTVDDLFGQTRGPAPQALPPGLHGRIMRAVQESNGRASAPAGHGVVYAVSFALACLLAAAIWAFLSGRPVTAPVAAGEPVWAEWLSTVDNSRDLTLGAIAHAADWAETPIRRESEMLREDLMRGVSFIRQCVPSMLMAENFGQ